MLERQGNNIVKLTCYGCILFVLDFPFQKDKISD